MCRSRGWISVTRSFRRDRPRTGKLPDRAAEQDRATAIVSELVYS